MALLSLVSVSGAPGVTTTSLALAAGLAAVDQADSVLVELASSGGVLGGWYDLPSDPGLASLAVAMGSGEPELLAHALELPGGLPAVLAPPSTRRTGELLRARSHALAHYLSSVEVNVVVDGGRVTAEAPLRPVLTSSDAVGIVVRGRREDLRLAAEVAIELRDGETEVGWILVGSRPWTDAELEEHYGIPVFGSLPHDAVSADAVAGRRRLGRRSALARSAHGLAGILFERIQTVTKPEEAEPQDEPTVAALSNAALSNAALSNAALSNAALSNAALSNGARP